jgi:hypothetical protein
MLSVNKAYDENISDTLFATFLCAFGEEDESLPGFQSSFMTMTHRA